MNMERPIAGAEPGPFPVVAPPRSGLSGAAIAIASVAGAGLLFLVLNNQRIAREQPADRSGSAAVISAPPPLPVALSPWPVAPSYLGPTIRLPRAAPAVLHPVEGRPYRSRALHPVVIEQWPPPTPVDPAQTASPPSWAGPPPPPTARNLDAPAIVQDSGEGRQWSGANAAGAAAEGGTVAPKGQGAKGASRVSPRAIGDLAQVIAVGTLIEAVLETPIDTSRPGMARAIVSKAVRSFDGSRVLIPRGSRLVGEIGGQAQGGNRLTVQWSQLILSNGVALDINSPGADANGRAGLDAQSHGGVGRFIGGVLQTVVTVGAAAIGARGVPVYYAMPIANGATQAVPARSNTKRLTVAAGAQITVVVARTLDFEGAGRS